MRNWTSEELLKAVMEHCPAVAEVVVALVISVALTNQQLLREMGADWFCPLRATLGMLRDMGYDIPQELPRFIDPEAPWRY